MSKKPQRTSKPAPAHEAPRGHGARYLLLVALPLLLAGIWLAWLPAITSSNMAHTVTPANSWLANLHGPLPLFLLQLLLVLVLAKAAGAIMRRIGQPKVIGEMVAGIVLGPSLFGWILPELQGWLFPPTSLTTLTHVGQLGVLIFMLTAGAEFELSRLRGKRRLTLVISHAGIALPMLLGVLLAWPLYADYAPEGASFTHFALFIGAALSVTAFPVLLRIIEALGYQKRPVATLAIASAAISDASAWILLAIIIAAVRAQNASAMFLNALVALALCAVLLGPLRRYLAGVKLLEKQRASAMISLIVGTLACALITELIGLHLLIGAFLAGLTVSSNAQMRHLVEEWIQPFATVLLLPIFFASTGLGTRIDNLRASEWLLCLGLIVVATFGKAAATFIAARWSGINKADCWRLGALMNTRGLMELIVLALGYELGLIDQRLYAILIMVAIATTLMTAPMLKFIDRIEARRNALNTEI